MLCSRHCHWSLLLGPVWNLQQHPQYCSVVPVTQTPVRGKMPRHTSTLSAVEHAGDRCRAWAALTLHGVARPQDTCLVKGPRGAAQWQGTDMSHVYKQTSNSRLKSACLARVKIWLQSPVETGHNGTCLKVQYWGGGDRRVSSEDNSHRTVTGPGVTGASGCRSWVAFSGRGCFPCWKPITSAPSELRLFST